MSTKLRYYLRGLGIGILVAALMLILSHHLSSGEMTDLQIRERALELGMVDPENMSLTQAVDVQESAETAADAAGEGAEEEPAEGTDTGTDAQDAESPDADATAPDGSGDPEGTDADAPADDTDGDDTGSNPDGTGTGGDDTGVTPEDTTPDDADTDTPNVNPDDTTDDPDKVPTDPTEDPDDLPKEGTVTIVIRSGMGSESVAKAVKDAGLVESADEFDTYLEKHGYSRKLRVGTYEVPYGATMEEMAILFTTSKK
ncbi:MAG: hypothetical protein K5891_01835 [Lachnospiraceae bacterium]|nr:hypothetical protein [Lachnospiraceae bacterium]